MYCSKTTDKNFLRDTMIYIISVILHEGGVKWDDEAMDLARKMKYVGLVGPNPLSKSTHKGLYIKVEAFHRLAPSWRFVRKHVESCPACQEKFQLIRSGVTRVYFHPNNTGNFSCIYLDKYGAAGFEHVLVEMKERLRRREEWRKREASKVEELKAPRCPFFTDRIRQAGTPEKVADAIAETMAHIHHGNMVVCQNCYEALEKHHAEHTHEHRAQKPAAVAVPAAA